MIMVWSLNWLNQPIFHDWVGLDWIQNMSIQSIKGNPALLVTQHFKSPCHSHSDLSPVPMQLKLKEEHLVFALGTLHLSGLNTEFNNCR